MRGVWDTRADKISRCTEYLRFTTRRHLNKTTCFTRFCYWWIGNVENAVSWRTSEFKTTNDTCNTTARIVLERKLDDQPAFCRKRFVQLCWCDFLCLICYRAPRYCMLCVIIVLVERRCTGCTNKWSSLLRKQRLNGITICVIFMYAMSLAGTRTC